jgi:serine/threonine-protein kinase
MVAAFVCIGGAFCGIYFFGAFSPAPMILPFGLFFFSAAQSFRAVVAVYVTVAVVQGLLMIAIISGTMSDHGLVSTARLGLGTLDQLLVLACVELVLLATFLLSRATRKATLEAIQRHDRAVRGIAQREALLREAKQDLERALQFGGLGRFTDTTLGAFRLGKVLGRGGMGEVYEAVHVTTHEPAAVKLLHAHVLADPDLLRRFMREAKIVASLNAPNVVRVLEIGGIDAPVPYMAMERLKGEDLADHLRRHRALSMSKTLTLVRHVGRGLEAARAAGIVHRDLKPRNLFFAEDGLTRRKWKILDFGVSKLGDAEGTQTKDMLVGTPAYMAPEQANGGQVTHKTDLYALGVIAYRILTGRPAFTGERTAETLYQVVYQMPPKPSEVSRVPPDIDLALAIAIAKDPAARFDSGAELANALEAAGKSRLSPELRARGERLLEKMPWGSGA